MILKYLFGCEIVMRTSIFSYSSLFFIAIWWHILKIVLIQEDRDNILRARASGKGVLTSPFKLLKSNHLGVVLTFAVYNTNLPLNATSEERISATVG